MKEEKILINGLQTNYKTEGIKNTKKTILILHGWGKGSDAWVKVQNILASFGFYVICPDLPGFGKTQIPSIAFTLDAYVDWVKEFTKTLELNNFFLVGHSFGGAVAVKFTAQHQEIVSRLILVAPAIIRNKVQKNAIQRVLRGSKFFSFLPFFGSLRRFFYRFVIRKTDYVGLSGVMKETFQNIVSEDTTAFLSKISIQTLLIWGKKDTATPYREASFVQKGLSHSSLETLLDAPHAINAHYPEKLAELIRFFIA